MTGSRRPEDRVESHRGAFGEFGGETDAFIDRSFREKIVLVGVATGGVDERQVDSSLDELSRLVDTAGADEVGRVVQRRTAPDPATFVGKGKASEIREVAARHRLPTRWSSTTSSARRSSTTSRGCSGRTAIDRTAVILDIFAQNAASQEGKAQVELALLRYRLPRIRGKGRTLSQQAGGIGDPQGPGRDAARGRPAPAAAPHAQAGGASSATSTATATPSARAAAAPACVTSRIVGYTNAGKSTLLNRLTDAGVLVEDRLFATLDATTRRLASARRRDRCCCTDTVGFVRKLPHQLVEAFKSTLEVVDRGGPARPRGRRRRRRPRGADRRRARRARRDRRAATCPS